MDPTGGFGDPTRGFVDPTEGFGDPIQGGKGAGQERAEETCLMSNKRGSSHFEALQRRSHL